jgi:hypothetical protein
MNPVSRISPVTDAEAAQLVRPDTLTDLAAQITSMPVLASPVPSSPVPSSPVPSSPVPSSPVPDGTGPVSRLPRPRWLIAVPLAAGLAAVALIATALGHPGQRVGPVSVGPAAAEALSFTSQQGYLKVVVRNPLADPSRYRAEFARHHLNITLRLLPVSPSIVGTVVYMGQSAGSSNLTPITAKGRCYTGGGGSACPVGVRIPADFHGSAQLVFGRAARPGERYESTVSAFAPGEVMHGMTVKGRTVTQVVAALRRRHVTAAVFNYFHQGDGVNRRQVPGSWYVYDATPWAPRQVMLFVGPTRTQVAPGPPRPGTPVPSPSPAS